jgi:predicted ribosomally synthesized peptide with nif11-like leader
MKTVEDFIQRLHHDPEFEQKAQAYEDSDEFMNFVKSEGYDFTLDQLLDMFKYEEVTEPDEEVTAPAKPASPAATPAVEAFMQRLEQDPEFERQAQSFEDNDSFMEFVRAAGYDFTLDQLMAGFQRSKQEPEPVGPQPAATPKLEVLPAPRPADDEEAVQPPNPSPDDGESQPQPVRLLPKFEGFSGGRRRGMKWRDAKG